MRSLIKLIKDTYSMVEPHEGRAVMKNVASLISLQTISYILPLIVFPYMFRAIGPDKFGLICFAQAFIQYFMILTDYGFGVSATKEISLCQHDHAEISKVFSSVMTVKFALALLSLFLLSLAVYFIPKFRNDWMVYVFSFGTVIGSTLFPVWFFQGTEKMKHISNVNIIGGLIQALSIFLLIRSPQDYLIIPVINSCVSLVTGLIGLRIVFKKFGISFKFPGYHSMRRQLTAGWDIFISIVAINAYTSTRIFTVGLLTNNTVTGFYSIAEKIANVVQTFPLYSFSQAIFPRLSKVFHKNKLKALEIMRKIQHITIYISLICLPIIFIFSHLIIKIACGKDYPEAVLSLRLLLVSILFISANAFRVQFLLVCGKTHIFSRIHIVMAMTGLPLIFLLVYSFGYAGAAGATVAIEAGIFGITYFTVKKLKFS